MQDKKIELYDDKWKDEWKSSRECYGPVFYHRKRLIREIIKNNSLKGKILDVGCGDGTFLSLFQESTNQLYGCDISEKAIEFAKLRFGDIATFTTGDITDISSLKGEFDVIICTEVLEHIEDDELALKTLYHKLKEGGHLIISTPHMKKYWTQDDEADGHVRRYEKEELENKIAKTGFIICESWTWGYPLFHLYHKVILRPIQRQTVKRVTKKPKLRQILSVVLRSFFYFDDFFKNKK